MTCQKDKLPFKIENNVLIGEEEEEIDNNGTSLAELILHALKTKPDIIGQIDALTGKQSTFQQMRENSVKCALWLKKQGVQSDDVIFISIHNHMDAYIPLLACFYIGALPIPLNVNPSIKNLERMVQLTKSKIIFANDKTSKMFYQVASLEHVNAKAVVFGQFEHRNESEEDTKIFVTLESILNEEYDETEITEFSCTNPRSMQNTLMLMCSSGSSGLPKVVEIPELSIVTSSTKQAFLVLPSDIVLWLGGLNWATGITLTIFSILSYATAIKLTGLDSEQICKTIEKYKVTVMLVETGMCHRLVKSGTLTKYNVSSLRKVLFGGSKIRDDAHKNIIKSLPGISMPIYGMTEVGIISTEKDVKKIGSSGRICKNMRIIIVSLDTKKPLGPNLHGEICIKCQTMMNGYYKDPEATKNVFDEDGWFHSGDVGYYDEDGNIFVINRIRNLIKYRGMHVSPIDIESMLVKHPAVSESVVIGVRHHFDGQRPFAFIIKQKGAELADEDLLKELDKLISMNMEDHNKLRGGIVIIENIPRLDNGKIDLITLGEKAKKQ